MVRFIRRHSRTFHGEEHLTLRSDLLLRVIIITTIYALISYGVIHMNLLTPDRLELAVPLLFVTCGIVTLISVLYDLHRFKADGR